MIRTRLAILTALVFAGSLLTAAAQEKGKDAKKDDKGTKATITKVDVVKDTISVTTDGGKKKMDVLVGKNTKFIGPLGGVSDEGIKDDRVAVGNEISVVFEKDGKTAREVHLPVRKKEDKKPDPKKLDKKPDPKKPGV